MPQVGVVSQPALGRRWWAATGHGAWTTTATGDTRRIHVSAIDDVSASSISFQSIEQWDDVDLLPTLEKLSRAVWRDRGYGDALPYMWLAEGRLELVAEFGVKEYDIAAIAPIVREAGGSFSAFDGSDRLDAESSLATNGVLHDAFLELLHEEDPDDPAHRTPRRTALLVGPRPRRMLGIRRPRNRPQRRRHRERTGGRPQRAHRLPRARRRPEIAPTCENIIPKSTGRQLHERRLDIAGGSVPRRRDALDGASSASGATRASRPTACRSSAGRPSTTRPPPRP